jgi:hypothetical protein
MKSITGHLHEVSCTLMIIYSSILLIINVFTKIVVKTATRNLYSIPLKKIVSLWDNV